MSIILNEDQFKQRYGQEAVSLFKQYPSSKTQANKEQTKTFGQEAISDIKGIGSALKNTLFGTADKVQGITQMERTGEQGKTTGFLKKVGTTLGGISQGVGDILMGAGKAILPQSAEEKVKQGLVMGAEKSLPILNALDKALGSPVGTRIEAYNNLPEKDKATLDAVLGAGMFGADIVGLGLGGKVVSRTAKAGGEILEQAGKKTLSAVDDISRGIGEIGEQVAKDVGSTIKKPTSPMKAVGEVLQGKAKDIKAGVKALFELDTTGVKTFKDLGNKINSRITELANVVDTDLGADTVGKKLKDLVLTAKTKGGAVVKLNPVKIALNQLDELYTKIGDVVEKANLKEIITKATKEGLTPLEINNLARVYGQEFGEKAFSKMGDALTSVNAKMYENTRKALKTLARQGIKGDTAKMADEAMSALYNTQKLVKKNIEAVNKITQKIRERGLFEKIGASLSKYGDVLTGGSLRGFVGGMLPRGAGYKVMNALDIEELLEKNLKIIQDAIKSGSDNDIVNILKKLEVKPDKLNLNSPTVGKTAETAKQTAYHGTQAKEIKGVPNATNGTMGKAFYLADDAVKAESFGKEAKTLNDTITLNSGKKIKQIVREPNKYQTANVFSFDLSDTKIKKFNTDREFFDFIGDTTKEDMADYFRLAGYDGAYIKDNGTFAIYNTNKLKQN